MATVYLYEARGEWGNPALCCKSAGLLSSVCLSSSWDRWAGQGLFFVWRQQRHKSSGGSTGLLWKANVITGTVTSTHDPDSIWPKSRGMTEPKVRGRGRTLGHLQ